MQSSTISPKIQELSDLATVPQLPEQPRAVKDGHLFGDVVHSALAQSKAQLPAPPVADPGEFVEPSWSHLTSTSFKEVAMRNLMGKWQLSHSINLPAHCALALTVQTQDHDEKSALIAGNAYRVATTAAMKKRSGHDVRWTESSGIMEAGTGLDGSVMLCPFVAANAGFHPKALMCYRTLYPHPTGIWNTIKATMSGHIKPLPLTPAQARFMPAGSLFEITCMGQLAVNGGLGAVAGVAAGDFFMAGASAGVAASSQQSGTYSVEVLALNGRNLFRMSLSEIGEEQKSLSAQFLAGITAQAEHIIPKIGEGALKAAIEKLGVAALSSTVDSFLRLSASGVLYHRQSDTNNLRFIVDIDKAGGAQLYQSLINLNAQPAIEAAHNPDSGVRFLREKILSHEDGKRAEVLLGPQQILMAEVADIVDRGELHLLGRPPVLFQSEIFRKRSNVFFFRSREVAFTTLSSKEEQSSTHAPIWRLTFNENVNYSTQDHVDKFLRLFLAAKASATQALKMRCKEMGIIKKIFTSADDLQTSIDIFLSHEGLKQIESAGEVNAKDAYLRVSYELSEERKPFLIGCPYDDLPQKNEALKIMDRYAFLKKHTTFNPRVWFKKMQEKGELRKEYQTNTFRNLDDDLGRIKEADKFALDIKKLSSSQDNDHYRAFFTKLGKSNGFHFEHAFLTLCTLAGPQNKLIHCLSIKGGGVCVESKDEGQITHPREEILSIFEQGLEA